MLLRRTNENLFWKNRKTAWVAVALINDITFQLVSGFRWNTKTSWGICSRYFLLLMLFLLSTIFCFRRDWAIASHPWCWKKYSAVPVFQLVRVLHTLKEPKNTSRRLTKSNVFLKLKPVTAELSALPNLVYVSPKKALLARQKKKSNRQSTFDRKDRMTKLCSVQRIMIRQVSVQND